MPIRRNTVSTFKNCRLLSTKANISLGSGEAAKIIGKNEKIDYLTFVADGEPTLDKNLGETIDLLQDLKVKIAVITNGSLLRNERTRNSLANCDLVSLKIDSGFPAVWKRVNQPVVELNWQEFIFGLKTFAKNFTGQIITESMLVRD